MVSRNKKEALAALVQAAKRGYKDPARVEREKAFAALKNATGFQDVLRAITDNQAAEKPEAKESGR